LTAVGEAHAGRPLAPDCAPSAARSRRSCVLRCVIWCPHRPGAHRRR